MSKNCFMAILLPGLIMAGVFLSLGEIAAEEQSGFVYLFKLYYDQGQLFADRDFEFKYDLIAENYTPETIKGPAYLGEVIAIGGKKEAAFQFSVQQGKMTAKAPYFSDADAVNFYNPEGRKLLTISVRESSVCDRNGVCNSETGEDQTNCFVDCFIFPSLGPSPGLITILPVRGSPNVRFILVVGLVVGTLLFLTVWFWRKRKNKHDLPPPQIQ